MGSRTLTATMPFANRSSRSLDRGVSERDPRVIGLEMEHWVDWHALRAHPRYQEVRARIGWSRGS